MEKVHLTHAEVRRLVAEMAGKIAHTLGRRNITVYPVPRGGVPVAYYLAGLLPGISIGHSPTDANIIVDDLIDSGATEKRFKEKYGHEGFFALIDKRDDILYGDKWIVFPWEDDGKEDKSAEDIVVRLLQRIGEDPTRQGLLETPKRVIKAWEEMTSGYKQNPKDVMKVFEDGAEGYGEMVIERNLPFYSNCEHHMLPFFGTADIAYIPEKHVIGVSKIQRVLDIFAKRLQVQERLTTQVADAFMEHLQPKGVGVILRARHLCMECRGVRTQGHHMETSALRGNFLDNGNVRSEFLALTTK